MRSFSWAPSFYGIATLVLLIFLFVQAQRVDSINDEHSQVLELLNSTQRLDSDLRQGLIQIYYDQYPNFDPVQQRLVDLGDILGQMQSSPYSAFRQTETGIEFFLSQMVNLHHERIALVASYMKHMVQLKNAVMGLSNTEGIDALAGRIGQQGAVKVIHNRILLGGQFSQSVYPFSI